MRSIYYLFSRFHVLILFVLLEVFALTLVFTSNRYQEVRFLNTSNAFAGNILGYANSFYSFINLGKNNKILLEENVKLKEQIKYQNIYSIDSSLPKSSEQYVFTYIPAKIVNNSINKSINYITLDKGRNEGVEKGFGVISSNGVVGVVTNVSENFSLVMSVISIKSLIGVRHKNTNALGNLRWNGSDPNTLQVDNLSKTLLVKKNDTIVTAGFSSLFPPDIVVAKVKKLKPDESTSFYEIDVQLTNNINSIGYVYIVKNNKKKEIDKLESQTANE